MEPGSLTGWDVSLLSAPRVLARDIGFTEGPVWTGKEIVVTSITRGQLYAMSLRGNDARVVAEPGGGPNGLAFDPATGRIWVAQNGRVHMPPRESVAPRTAGIQSWITGGEVETHYEDAASAPNDCVIGPDGRLWFTNPSGDPHEGEPKVGQVCALDIVTGHVEVLWETLGYPNGLAFGVERDQFFLAETRYGRIVEFDVNGGDLQVVRTLQLSSGYPDGLAVSAEGHVLVAGTTSGALHVFDADGHEVATTDFGVASMPTNVCFAGDDLRSVVVTLAKGGRVVVMESAVQGQRSYGSSAALGLEQTP